MFKDFDISSFKKMKPPSAYASGWGVRCTRGDFKKK